MAVVANMVALIALRVPLSLPVRGFIRSIAVLSTSCSAAQLSAAGRDGGRAAIAVAGCHGRDRRLRSDLGLDEAGHPRRERNVDIDLGEAQEPAVGAHHPVVVGDGEHRPGAESMAVDRGHCRQSEGEDASEQGVHAPDVPVGAIAVDISQSKSNPFE